MRAFKHAAINVDELDSSGEPLVRQFWETRSDLRVLKWLELYDVARTLTPSRHPISAESTIAVEDEHRSVRRLCDV